MIRPITIAAFLLACGSGLYLYQSKHEVQLLDRIIEKTVRDTGALREQSRLLSTEWNMLNDPDRLRQFSNTYLPSLKSINPAQYTSLADLGTKLPLPQAELPASTGEEPALEVLPAPEPTIAVAPVLPPAIAEKAAPAPRALTPRPSPIIASVVHPQEFKPAAVRAATPDIRSRPVATAENRPSEQRPVEPATAERHPAEPRGVARFAEGRPDVRTPSALAPPPIILGAPRPSPQQAFAQPVAPRPAPVPAAAPAPLPYGGSLLGMARGSLPPVPRPTPVSANYGTN